MSFESKTVWITGASSGIGVGDREIVVAEGIELQLGELRRTPEALFDQVATMVANGYMEMLETERVE